MNRTTLRTRRRNIVIIDGVRMVYERNLDAEQVNVVSENLNEMSIEEGIIILNLHFFFVFILII